MTLKPIDTPSVGTPTAHSSSGLVQPMFHAASATSDASGNITFTFDSVFTGQILIGSFSCPSAPYAAQFTAFNNSQEVYSWQSSNNPGPLRASENQQITVSGTGLEPSTQYVMNWVGYSTVGGFAPQIVPESHSDVSITTNQGGFASSYTVLPFNVVTAILPAPASGFAYRIHSINTYFGTSPTTSWDFTIYSLGQSFNSYLLVGAGDSTNGYNAISNFLLNGLLVNNAIEGLQGGFANGLEIVIHYDVIQI